MDLAEPRPRRETWTELFVPVVQLWPHMVNQRTDLDPSL
jgi:hypothetical protein